MVIGLGIDTVQVSRLEALLDRHPERAADRLFSAEELADCAGRMGRGECLAARFAVKEAFLKALGTGLRDGMTWRDISLRNGLHGRPEVVTRNAAARKLAEIGGTSVHVSVTHDAGIAVAVVVIERS